MNTVVEPKLSLHDKENKFPQKSKTKQDFFRFLNEEERALLMRFILKTPALLKRSKELLKEKQQLSSLRNLEELLNSVTCFFVFEDRFFKKDELKLLEDAYFVSLFYEAMIDICLLRGESPSELDVELIEVIDAAGPLVKKMLPAETDCMEAILYDSFHNSSDSVVILKELLHA